MVRINGENFEVSGKSVSEYLHLEGYDKNRVAVELNGDIVPKAKYDETIFKDGDVLEVVSFVGGG